MVLRFGLLTAIAATAAIYVLVMSPHGSLAGHDYVPQCRGSTIIFSPGVRISETSHGLEVDCTIFEPDNPFQAGDIIESINGTKV
jgi:hypothetical protein